MNIAFDARYLQKQGSGVHVYVFHILKALIEEGGHAIFPIITESQKSLLPEAALKNLILCPYGIDRHPHQDLWMALMLPRMLSQNRIDLLFCPAFIVPPVRPRARMVSMVHDLAFHFAPESMTRAFALYARFMTRLAVRNSDHIITPTQAVRREVLAHYRLPENRVTHIHHGSPLPDRSAKALTGEEIRSSLDALGVQKPFFLSVGNLEPRKDLARLAAAFQHLRREKGMDSFRLVLCGERRWKWDEVEEGLRGKLDHIVLTGYVQTKPMRALMAACDAVFVSSRYEGFGLPLLEAMSAGKVVFASDIPSFREIGADAVIYMDLGDAGGFSKSILNVLRNDSLRGLLEKKAGERAFAFSWKACADRTLHLFNRILSAAPRSSVP
jgi:glycosyltransferase involved in cell wall biosynthesis